MIKVVYVDKLNILDVVEWLNYNNVRVEWYPPTSKSIYYASGLAFSDMEALTAFKLKFGV